MDSIKFRRHFNVEGAGWFAPRMDEYICKMSGVPVGMMTVKDFREGGTGRPPERAPISPPRPMLESRPPLLGRE